MFHLWKCWANYTGYKLQGIKVINYLFLLKVIMVLYSLLLNVTVTFFQNARKKASMVSNCDPFPVE